MGESWQLASATNLGQCYLQGERQLPVSLATVAAELFVLLSSTLRQAGNDHGLRTLYPGHYLSPQTPPEFKDSYFLYLVWAGAQVLERNQPCGLTGSY